MKQTVTATAKRLLDRTAARKAAGLVPAKYPVPAAKPSRVALPCVRVGDLLTGHERELLGLDHRKEWMRCDHPDQPLGAAVCRCKGCGPKCPGYQPDKATSS